MVGGMGNHRKLTQIGVVVPKSLHIRMKRRAVDEESNVSAIVRQAVIQYLQKKRVGKGAKN